MWNNNEQLDGKPEKTTWNTKAQMGIDLIWV
jgi:hypothetical protein